jgi:ribosomal protein S3AE
MSVINQNIKRKVKEPGRFYKNKMAKAKKKKKFFDVNIPIIQKTTQLQAYNIEDLDKTFIKYDLTRFLRGKSMLLVAKVKVENDKAQATPQKIMLMPSFLKRMVRKGTNYVEDSFFAKCKDNEVQIKPFLVTRRRVSRAVKKALREKAREELTNYVKDKKSDEMFDEIIQNKIQKILSLKLKKIYPLSLCEIRIFQVKNKE